MVENWIEVYQTGIILFLIILMFAAGAAFMLQYNQWRNERSMHKRLEIRHKREMEAKVKYTETNITPIILTEQSTWPQHLIDEYFNEDLDRNRIVQNIMSHFDSQIKKCLEIEISDPIYDHKHKGERIVTTKLAIIPKEHLKLFKS